MTEIRIERVPGAGLSDDSAQDGPDKLIEPAREGQDPRADGWPTFNELLGSIRDGVNEGIKVVGAKLEVAAATKELNTSIDKFTDPFLDADTRDLTKQLGQAVLFGDTKAVQKLLNERKGDEEWEDALHILSDEFDGNGIMLDWDKEKGQLRLLRGPSFHIKGPDGIKLEFSAGKEAPEVFKITGKRDEIPKGHKGPWWEYTKLGVDAIDNSAQDLGKTAVTRLNERTAALAETKRSLDLFGALEALADGEKEVKPDKTTELAKALLDKNIAPLLREVRKSRKPEDLAALADALDERLQSIGLYAKILIEGDDEEGKEDGNARQKEKEKDKGEKGEKGELELPLGILPYGLEVGCHSKGASDGWAIILPIERDMPVKAATGNNKEWREPKLHQNLLYVPDRETKEVTPQRALRALIERLANDAQLKQKWH